MQKNKVDCEFIIQENRNKKVIYITWGTEDKDKVTS